MNFKTIVLFWTDFSEWSSQCLWSVLTQQPGNSTWTHRNYHLHNTCLGCLSTTVTGFWSCDRKSCCWTRQQNGNCPWTFVTSHPRCVLMWFESNIIWLVLNHEPDWTTSSEVFCWNPWQIEEHFGIFCSFSIELWTFWHWFSDPCNEKPSVKLLEHIR